MNISCRIIIVAICFTFMAVFQAQAQLRVSDNGRFLVDQEGKPFYWLGDTGWALFQKPDREDVKYYFETRAQQGFSVIHAAVYHVNPFVLPPLSNAYGDRPFINDDPRVPDVTPGNNPDDSTAYDYWDHVEYVIDMAASNGLYINLLPIFGVVEGEGYNFLTPLNAYDYGKFIGGRFKDKWNIIWCMGGDCVADNDMRRSVWDLLARGVTEGVSGSADYGKTLMTYHPRGGHTSSEYYQDAAWLDFNMFQTWASYTQIYQAASSDYNRKPAKPVLHGEGAYEEGPEYPTKPITPLVIRKQAYWAYFAGAYHTYGNSNVWSFGTNPYYISRSWKEALTSQGAACLSVSREILELANWFEFVPDPSIITEGSSSGETLNVAMLSEGSDKILVYFSSKATADIDLGKISESHKSRAYWIDPQTGRRQLIGHFRNDKPHTFSTPEGGEDALLYIEALKKSE